LIALARTTQIAENRKGAPARASTGGAKPASVGLI
jgi:hypothetical protein